MPTFHAHIPAQKFSSEEKRALADALNLALHEAMGTPMDDRFVIISEHKDDELGAVRNVVGIGVAQAPRI